MVLYVRELKQEEKRRLRAWLTGQDSALERRAHLILLSSQGYRVTEIAQLLKAHPANLRKWIHRFNAYGCRGLVTVRSGGAKPRFTQEQKAQIVSLAETKPRDLGLNYTSWTLHRLAEQARKRRIVDQISHECVRQILRAAHCVYRYQAP